jgi:ethanolamine utilization protein EutN
VRTCEVIGDVVAAAHHPDYDGRKVLVVRPINPDGAAAGASFLAVDTVQAGIGDRVLVVSEGNAARQILGRVVPIRSLVVGVIDTIETGIQG